MTTFECKCHTCGKSLIRKRQTAPVKLHFCNNDCKAAYQRTLKPVTRAWLVDRYVTERLDTTQIAHIVNRDPKSVWNWLKDFGIPTRPRGGHTLPHSFKKGHKGLFTGMRHTEETKRRLRDIAKADGRVPFDPAIGSYMKGRRGDKHPNWKGGITAERQSFYLSAEWLAACKAVRIRDQNKCQRCGMARSREDGLDIHHIVSFVCKPLRAEPSNLVLLCEPCHYWVHSKANKGRRFILPCP